MLGLLEAVASSPEMVSAPEQAGILRTLPIAPIGGIFEGLSLRGFVNNSQNSILFGLREIYVSIVVRDVDDDVKQLGHVSPLSGNPLADVPMIAPQRTFAAARNQDCLCCLRRRRG